MLALLLGCVVHYAPYPLTVAVDPRVATIAPTAEVVRLRRCNWGGAAIVVPLWYRAPQHVLLAELLGKARGAGSAGLGDFQTESTHTLFGGFVAPILMGPTGVFSVFGFFHSECPTLAGKSPASLRLAGARAGSMATLPPL